MLRALHVAAGNLYGGVEALLLTLARERGQRASLVPSFCVFFEGRLSEELRRTGVKVQLIHSVRWSRPWTLLKARAEFEAMLQRDPPDVAICHSPWAESIVGAVLRKARIPLVYLQHGTHHRLGIVDVLARFAPPDLILVNSRYSAQSTSNLFPGIQMEVWNPPLPSGIQSVAGASRDDVRAALTTPKDIPVIVQVSRMEVWKGHARNLEALARLSALSWELWFVGGAQRPEEERYEAELKALAQRLGIQARVRFLGQRQDVPSLLAAADLFCQPNVEPEPYGLVFLEALAAGLPVIASKFGGSSEIVDSTCGILVDKDIASLKTALQTLLTDGALRRNLGAAGPARALALGSPERQLAKLELLLRSVASFSQPELG